MPRYFFGGGGYIMQKVVTFWATFVYSNFFFIFTIIGSFKAWFAMGILRVQKGLNVDVFYFQIELW
jgi:hypothetical protein